MTRNRTTQLTASFLLPGLLFGLLATLALAPRAEDSVLDTGPRAFPYKGSLHLEGAPFTGQVDLQIRLSDNPAQLNPPCRYTEVHSGVSVFGGSFRVNVGSVDPANNPIAGCVFNSEAIFITVNVRQTTEGDQNQFVQLEGAQQIRPVPFALWTAESSDMLVERNTNIDGVLRASAINALGAVNLKGNGTIGSLSAGGDVTATVPMVLGDSSADTVTIEGDWATVATTFTNNITANDDVDVSTLTVGTVAGLASINPGAQAFTINGNLNTNNNLNAANFTFTGSITQFQDLVVSSTATLTVSGNTTTQKAFVARGLVEMSHCRACLLASDGNQGSKGFACVRLKHGEAQVMKLSGDVDSNDHFGLTFLCDNGNSTATNVGSAARWPHE